MVSIRFLLYSRHNERDESQCFDGLFHPPCASKRVFDLCACVRIVQILSIFMCVCVIKRNVHQSFIVSNNIIQFMHDYIVSQVQKAMLLGIQKHASSDYTVSLIQQSTQRARRKVNVSLPGTHAQGVRACAHSGDYIVSFIYTYQQ